MWGFFRRILGGPAARAGRSRSCRSASLQLETLEVREVRSVTPAQVHAAPPPVLEVHPGQSIQKAVDAAAPGSTILIDPGTYKQMVTINKQDLHLIGQIGPGGALPVLLNPGHLKNGIVVGAGGKGVVLENLIVRGFDGNGVYLTGVSGFTLKDLQTQQNGEYGLYSIDSAHGSIQGCYASGSNDTGILIDQSTDVKLVGNVAHDNVIGIEVENSTHIQVIGNFASSNTVGIFEDLLPGLPREVSSDNLIQGNVVYYNNRRNTAAKGDEASALVPGFGILIVGGSHSVVEQNLVFGNGYAGIVLASGLDLIALGAFPANAYKHVDPNPENVSIQNNVVLTNGKLFSYRGAPPAADLIWTQLGQLGKNDHWTGNTHKSSSPHGLG